MRYLSTKNCAGGGCTYLPPQVETLDITVEKGFQESSESANIDSWEYDGEQNM